MMRLVRIVTVILLLLMFVFEVFAEGTWTTFTNANYISDIAVQGEFLWCATNGGVVRWNTHDMSYVKYTTDNGLAHNYANSIAVGSNSEVWVGTKKGISRYDGETWTTFTKDDGLAGDAITSIAIGSHGDVWCGTVDNANDGTYYGLCRYDGEAWKVYTWEDGLAHNWVFSIAIDTDGTMLFHTYLGVTRYDGETWISYPRDDELDTQSTNAMAIGTDGSVWFATRYGASRYDSHKWTTYTQENGLPDNFVSSLAIASDGKIWFGTFGGLALFEPQHLTIIEINDVLSPEISINGNYPNPFNQTTTIGFVMPHEEIVHLTIYNIMGQKVRTLLSETKTAGTYSILWNGRDEEGNIVSSGVYFTNLTSGLNNISHRMLLLK